MSDSTTRTSLDTAFETLSHPTRQRILVLLGEHDSLSVDELCNLELVLESEPLGQCSNRLRHVHLPKLADVGYVEWDRTENDVRRGREFDSIEFLLEIVETHQNERSAGWS